MGDKDRREGKSRITRDYVMHWDLIQETGVQSVDDYLYCLMNILRIHLGDDLRAAFLIGSYAHGGYTKASDIDVCFVFKDGVDRFREVWSIVEHMQLLLGHKVDPMYYGPEAPLYDLTLKMDALSPVIRLVLKEHSLLLLGEDLRPKISLRTPEEMLEYVLRGPLNTIKHIHNNPPEGIDPVDMPITYPLTDPTPDKEDRGLGDGRLIEKRILTMARALIMLNTGEFPLNKRDIADTFESRVGGSWAGLVKGVSIARYGDAGETQRLQALSEGCRNMTAFENYFLECLLEKEHALAGEIIGLDEESA